MYQKSLKILQSDRWQVKQSAFFWDTVYSVSQKIPPPRNFLTFFPNGWEFLVQILRAY